MTTDTQQLKKQIEKNKRLTAKLIIANKELVFQNKEKEKRAAELIIANKELLFQNKEKEKRAAELIIANKELLFQNKEKEKRAAELIIANKELLFQNKEKEKRANEKEILEVMAYNDPLTNIYNRQMFSKMIKKEKENQKRHGDTLCIIMFDIDHFKAVNDRFGHDIGDKVLITLSKLVSKNLRVNDVFARWGGEEFMILLPRTEINDAYAKAEELRSLIEKYSDNTIPNITASFGLTKLLDTDKEQSCFKRVDEALYGAKIRRNDVMKL